MNPGGPPTPGKPGISVAGYEPGDTTSIFPSRRVDDIAARQEERKARGAQFVTEPTGGGAEVRCYLRNRPTGTSPRPARPPACRCSRRAVPPAAAGSPARATAL
jgi:hypothetical protein